MSARFDFSHLNEEEPKKKKFDFSHLGEEQKPVAEKKESANFPWYVKAGLGALQSAQRPLSKAIPERARAAGQGIKEIAQGPQQIFGGPGTTQQIAQQRAQYEGQEGAKDPLAQLIKEQVKTSPYFLPFVGPVGKAISGMSILPRMLSRGGAFAGIKGAEYTPEQEDRLFNAAKAGALGAGIEFAPYALNDLPELVLGTSKYKALREKLGQESKQKTFAELESKTPELEKAVEEKSIPAEEAEQKYQSALAEQEAAKARLGEASEKGYLETGKKEALTMQRQAQVNQNELKKLNQNISALSHQMENLPSIPKLGEHPNSHIENAELASHAVKQAEKDIKYAEDTHKLVANIANNADRQIEQHLNSGADYPVRTSRQLRHEIKSIEDNTSAEYKKMMNDLKESKFILTNSSDRIQRMNEASARARAEYGEDPTGEFAHAISKAPTAKDVTAHDFMNKQKSFRDARYDVLQRAKSEPDAVKRAELFKVYRDLKPFEDFVNETLNEGLGRHAQRYRTIMDVYRDQIYPLRENAVADRVMSGKPLSGDIAGELSGYHEGQELLRNIANSNPEIRRNIVGQQLKNNPERVYNPDERLLEYTQNMPELNQLLANRARTQESLARANENIETAKDRHMAAKHQETEAHRIKKEKEGEIEKEKKEHVGKIEEREKEKARLQKELTEHKEKSKKLEKEIESLEKHRKELEIHEKAMQEKDRELKKAAKRKDISLKEKMKAESELKKHREKLARAEKAIKEVNKEIKAKQFGYRKILQKIWQYGGKAIRKGGF